MANVMTADAKTVSRTVEERYCCYCYYSWLEDYLERLDGKDAYREFQENHLDARNQYYYTLIASLLA
jgi:hypothetical protein